VKEARLRSHIVAARGLGLCVAAGAVALGCGSNKSRTGSDAGADGASDTVGAIDAADVNDALDGSIDAPDAMPFGVLSAEPPDPVSLPCTGRLGFPGLPVTGYADNGSTTTVQSGRVNADNTEDVVIGTGSAVQLLLGNGDGTYGQPTQLLALTNNVTRLRDLNGDSRADLIVGSRTSSSLYVMLNDGTGGFSTMQTLNAGVTSTQAIEIEDLNNDNKVDLIVFNDQSGIVSVLLATSTGFAAANTYSASSSQASRFAVGDITGDGRPDVVTSTIGSSISIIVNNGAGAFGAPTAQASVAGAGELLVRDLNGDGKRDVVVAGLAATTPILGVHLNEGAGVLGAHTAFPSGTSDSVRSLVAADVDGDTDVDILAASAAGLTNPLAIVRGNGTGTFASPLQLAADGAGAIALKDMNGDGSPDLVTAGNAGLSTYLNLGVASLFDQRRVIEPTSLIHAARIVDINGDGAGDLVSGGFSSNNQAFVATRLVSGGTVAAGATTYVVSVSPRVLIRTDLDNDSDLDLVAGYGGVQALLNTGTGTLTAKAAVVMGTTVAALLAGDFDSDGWRDVIEVDNDGFTTRVRFLHGMGDGTFTQPVTVLTQDGIVAAGTGDLDKDGHLDLLISYTDPIGTFHGVSVLRGNGNATFAAPVQVPYVGHPPGGLLVRDMNADGKPDIVDWDGVPAISLGNATTSFSAPAVFEGPRSDFDGVLADLNGDGALDVVTSGWHTVTVTLGNGDGTLQPPNRYEAFGPGRSISVADVDGDGRLDIVVNHASGVSLLPGRCST
jgi:hypothetical protein